MTEHGPDPVEKPTDAESNNVETCHVDEPRKHDKRKRPRQVLVNEDELHLLEEKSKKADEYYGHYMRARADLDNMRKRIERDKADFVKYANERLLSEIIPILDNFERAFAAAEKVPATHNFAVGVEMILKQLREVLARYGVEELYPAGEPFDPAKHEAAETVETAEHPDHTVVDVLQRGYVLNGRVVQPAVVRVAVNPEAAPASLEADSSLTKNEKETDSDTEEVEDGQDHRH
ncbi:MAG: nucleotide exchange factor GrpE [Verrucomicrobia bacterium]|nr:nucleotide exchange factor GrpE [Verrucomicrobiota bacterium]